MNTKVDILIKDIQVYTQNAAREVIKCADVAVKDGKITAIVDKSKAQSAPQVFTADTVIDGKGKTLFPGMHNMHVHFFQSVMKGLGADKELLTWLESGPFPIGPKMDEEAYGLSCQLVLMESLKCGVTTAADFHYAQHNQNFPHVSMELMEKYGIRGIFMNTYNDIGAEYGVPEGFMAPVSDIMDRTERLVKKYNNDEHPLLTVYAGPSVCWTASEEYLRAVTEYSKETGVLYTMHLLETHTDNEFMIQRYGKPAMEFLDSVGFLTDRLLAVHNVKLQEEEMDLYADRGVHAVYCPAANAYLGSGIPPMASMIKHGINVTMGTDGAASNNSSDMIESLKLGLLLQKVGQEDPEAMNAQQMLDCVTVNPARSEHRTDVGSIEVGKLADMFIYNPAYARSTPCYDAMVTLMYNSSQENIETTIVNGKIVYDKGKFACGADEQEISAKVMEKMKELVK